MVAFKPLIAPLFVPANRADRFEKADTGEADALIIDLEDAVPAAEKTTARNNLSQLKTLQKPIYVRINSVESPWFNADVNAVTSAGAAGIMLPKVAGAADIEMVNKLTGRRLPIIALVESVIGLSRLRQTAEAENVAQIAFGSIDFSLDLNCQNDRDALLFARSELVYQSRLASLPAPLDGVTTAVSDDVQLVSDCQYATCLGFGGKLAVHPRQIAQIKKIFQPTAEEILWADKIIAAAESSGGGAVLLDGQMIDLPVIEKARRLLAQR